MAMRIDEILPLYLPLESAEAGLEIVGGKGTSLARMVAAGFPVPPGFHITTAAYHRFVRDNSLHEAIVEAATGAVVDDPASLEQASAAIRALFDSGTMPGEVAAAVRQAYAALGTPDLPVAVRSSATAEDLPGMSFAGQQDTYLNVIGEEALLEAVRRCWASLWTARSIGYRLKMRIDQRSVAMGVVVQIMVPSEVSGVLFTANPATGERTEILVNASYGLGEAVVSGQVTPDSFVVDKTSLAPKETALGTKEVMILPADGQGTTTRTVPENQRGRQVLSKELLRELGALAVQVEKEFGGTPQDIEWAVADKRCWLLQARPLTGLPPVPLKEVRWEPSAPGTKWVRRQVAENMPEPLSPLFGELYLRDGLDRSTEGMWAALGVPISLDGLYARPAFTTVNGYAYMRADFIKADRKAAPLLLRFYRSVVPAVFRRGVDYWRDNALPSYLSTVEQWKKLDLGSASDEKLLDGIRELAGAEAAYWWWTTVALAVAKMSDLIFDRFLSLAMPRSGLSSALFLRGFPSKALEGEAELQAIADQVRASEELRDLVASTPARRLPEALAAIPVGRPVLDRLRLYLDRYGHQIYNLDFAVPTQAEDPTPMLLSLKAQVARKELASPFPLEEGSGQGEVRSDALARQAEMVQERERLMERTARSLDPLRRRLFLRIVRWAQRLGPYREEALFYVGSAWPALRRLALELGRRLADAGSLDAAEDLFYLETAELMLASDARHTGQPRPDLARSARERRELREARKRLHPPAAVPPAAGLKLGPFKLSGWETQKRNLDQGSVLRGFAVSPGKVTAPASVILSPADFDRMVPGTILVCPTTTPAWTPLFAQALGLVTDIGGVAAHGSIVAREYGIPAVMGTGNGTQRIANGEQVTVDGDGGTVILTIE